MKTSFQSYVTKGIATVATALCLTFPADQAQAQSEPYIGTIATFGFNFCPRGWAEASGGLLPISSNQSLFSLFGTIYGGDGRTNFALPDLRGRSPMGAGAGPGLTPVAIGERIGSEAFSITSANQLAPHNHIVNGTNETGDKNGPGSDFLAVPNQADLDIYHNGPSNRTMDPAVISMTGASAPIFHRTPALALKTCVALVGLYPPRN